MNRDPLLSCLRGLDIHWWYSVTLETGEIEILMVLTNPFLNIHLHLQSSFASLRYIFPAGYVYMFCLLCNVYIYIYNVYIYIISMSIMNCNDFSICYVPMFWWQLLVDVAMAQPCPSWENRLWGVFRCQERSLWCLTMASQCMVRLPCPQKWCGFELVRYDLGRFLIPYGKLT